MVVTKESGNDVCTVQTAWCTQAGIRHGKRREACQDAYRHTKAGKLRFWGLADGQSGKSHSALGGKMVLDAIFQYLKNQGISQLHRREYQDEIQFELLRKIRTALKQLATELAVEDLREFSSTLVVFALDTESREYIAIHLGDGAILAVTADDTIVTLSAPENGITQAYTWLTTSPGVLQHIRIDMGQIGEYRRVVLVTDGATALCRGRNITPAGQVHLRERNNQDALVALVKASPTEDDASCIILDFL